MKTAPKRSWRKRPGVDVTAVSNLAIWGNHSATQYPDFYNAEINGKPATDVNPGRSMAQGRFHQHRAAAGAAIIKARGSSSAASAANAAIDTVRSIVETTAAGDWHSVACALRRQLRD